MIEGIEELAQATGVVAAVACDRSGANLVVLRGTIEAGPHLMLRQVLAAVAARPDGAPWLVAELERGCLVARPVGPLVVCLIGGEDASSSTLRIVLDGAARKHARPPQESADLPADGLERMFHAVTRDLATARALAVAARERLHDRACWDEVVGRATAYARGDADRALFVARCDAWFERARAERLELELTSHRSDLDQVARAVAGCSSILAADVDDNGIKVARDILRSTTSIGDLPTANALRGLTEHVLAVTSELQACAFVQDQFRPREPLISPRGGRIAAATSPHRFCSGDWHTWREVGPESVLIAIADVTGHGLAASLGVALIRIAFEASLRAEGPHPVAILTHLDQLIHSAGGGHVSATCHVAILDEAAGVMRAASAAHPFAYLMRPGNNEVELQPVIAKGDIIGKGTLQVELREIAIDPGDLICWYTDGVTDAVAPGGVPFGDRRFRRLLRDTADDRPENIARRAVDAVDAYRGEAARTDDTTVVIGRVG